MTVDNANHGKGKAQWLEISSKVPSGMSGPHTSVL